MGDLCPHQSQPAHGHGREHRRSHRPMGAPTSTYRHVRHSTCPTESTGVRPLSCTANQSHSDRHLPRLSSDHCGNNGHATCAILCGRPVPVGDQDKVQRCPITNVLVQLSSGASVRATKGVLFFLQCISCRPAQTARAKSTKHYFVF